MPRKRLIDVSSNSSGITSNTNTNSSPSCSNPAEFLRIALAPRRSSSSSSTSRRHHTHLTVRGERKAAFTKANWIQKHSAKCKLTLPKFKVSLVQQPVSGIVDKLRGAWSRVKHLLNTPSSSSSSSSKSFCVSKRSSSSSSSRCQSSSSKSSTGYSHLNSSSPGYHQDAVADCIEFIKQSAAKV